MNKFKIFSLALVATTIAKAQDLEPAKKAIDAEQFEKAKSLLKSVIQAKPSNGKAAFLIGTIYLKQNISDSASIYFQKGLLASEGARLNNIGLGQLELDANNKTAAQAKFDLVIKELKKKDTEEYVYIARAFMNADKPDYKSAIAVLTKAATANPNDAQVQLALGDAYYGDKNQNDSYRAYLNAFQFDNSLIRAKMQLGVLLKGAKAYPEAIKAYDEVVKLNPNYGPVYREFAYTYYYWAKNQPKTYTENIRKALSNYEKYMSLTDYSLSSRMRHADFLILAKDYKALEVQANEMKKLDKVNPRILCYLGYASFENGNNDGAINALTEFIAKGSNKIIAGDYYYLGLAQIKKAANVDTKEVDAAMLAEGTKNLSKGIEMSPSLANALNEIGKDYYAKKLYTVSQTIFELAISNPNSENFREDNNYYGLVVYIINKYKEIKDRDMASLQKADLAQDAAIVALPTYSESYLYKARINDLIGKYEIMTNNYQLFVDGISAKGETEITKNKAKFIEAYNKIAENYGLLNNKVKAKEFLNKTLALDPSNAFAIENMKLLK